MKNARGYSLLETALALSLCIFLCAGLFAVWAGLQENRLRATQLKAALFIAQNELERQLGKKGLPAPGTVLWQGEQGVVQGSWEVKPFDEALYHVQLYVDWSAGRYPPLLFETLLFRPTAE